MALLFGSDRTLAHNNTTSAPSLSSSTQPPPLQSPATSGNLAKPQQASVRQQYNDDPKATIYKQAEPPRRQRDQVNDADEYLIGVGIADITGPAADVNLVSSLPG